MEDSLNYSAEEADDGSSDSGNNFKVVVRVRPPLPRELNGEVNTAVCLASATASTALTLRMMLPETLPEHLQGRGHLPPHRVREPARARRSPRLFPSAMPGTDLAYGGTRARQCATVMKCVAGADPRAEDPSAGLPPFAPTQVRFVAGRLTRVWVAGTGSFSSYTFTFDHVYSESSTQVSSSAALAHHYSAGLIAGRVWAGERVQQHCERRCGLRALRVSSCPRAASYAKREQKRQRGRGEEAGEEGQGRVACLWRDSER
eukprot:3252237-Rhodomonas_salina.1